MLNFRHPFLMLVLCVGLSRQRQAIAPPSSNCRKNTLIVPPEARRSETLIIAHRGASYHVPEHSLPAYRLALELGADFIEPDLVVTADAQLIAMHTLDLNVTTDVAEKFPRSRTWYSKTAQRNGYWSFNFTLAEIQTLKLKQRLPTARSKAMDGMFGVPTLTEILKTLLQWNSVDLAIKLNISVKANDTTAENGRPSSLQTYQSGVYIEFKESAWILNETGIDIVELLYQHVQQQDELWNPLLHCFTSERFDDYVVPGLVLQSFDARDLRHFHELWNNNNNTDNSRRAEPNYILLVSKRDCWADDFWFRIEKDYRLLLSGIGCEKACILEHTELAAAFQAKAIEFGLVLHPWTERPEDVLEQQFGSAWEEMRYMICKTPAVRGFFTESVDTAVRAAILPCQELTTSTDSTTPKDVKTGLCYESRQEANIYVGLASFIMGTFLAVVTCWTVSHCQKRHRPVRSRGSGHRTQVPTEEEEPTPIGADLT